jgi:probable phosphoglycerate mutase
LVRHGQGACNVTGTIGGERGCTGLTELGVEQVAGLAARLSRSGELAETSALYSSVLPRAIETAELLAPALGLELSALRRDCGLCELHPGEADGLVWEDYLERYEAPDFDVDPASRFAPGGESWISFVDRCAASLEGLALAHRGELVVLATHAGFIEASVLRFLVGSPAGSPHLRLRLRTAHASMTEWERSAAGWRLLRYNDAYTALS